MKFEFDTAKVEFLYQLKAKVFPSLSCAVILNVWLLGSDIEKTKVSGWNESITGAVLLKINVLNSVTPLLPFVSFPQTL